MNFQYSYNVEKYWCHLFSTFTFPHSVCDLPNWIYYRGCTNMTNTTADTYKAGSTLPASAAHLISPPNIGFVDFTQSKFSLLCFVYHFWCPFDIACFFCSDLNTTFYLKKADQTKITPLSWTILTMMIMMILVLDRCYPWISTKRYVNLNGIWNYYCTRLTYSEIFVLRKK